MRDFGASRDVGDRHARIAGRFDPHELCLWTHRAIKRLQVGRWGEADFNPAAIADFVEQPIRAAVDVRSGDDMVARAEEHRGGVNCRHARGKRQGRQARFEIAERFLERGARGVAAARVVELSPLAGAGLNEGRTGIDRRDDVPGLRVAVVTDVDGSRAEMHGGDGTMG